MKLAGSWRFKDKIPSADAVVKQFESLPQIKRLTFDTKDLGEFDTALLTFLKSVIGDCAKMKIRVDREGLPKGVQRLLDLASAVPEQKGARRETTRESFLTTVGNQAIHFAHSTGEMLGFIGETFLAFIRLLRGKAPFRRSDFVVTIQQCGADALPIVTLISFLVGLILAFVGALQLRLFGAEVYVANLVGIGMVRVLGAVMTGIIMAGRTGASFAAELGTMEVNEEIDALRTLGIQPMEFLVLPRMLALLLMMPLLCLYADLMGVLGGIAVGVGMLHMNLAEYLNQTKAALNLNHLWIGLVHGSVFGVLVALSGCLRGMKCGRSAAAVGTATTSAVVTGIVSIVIATAILTVIFDALGI
jgi:phospholipid/cholesterol/gamma-HCH transport system permease protein